MGKINLLSPSVANLIAAGEVVDRPASAVKELLENAIDSGATAITVEIQRGGISFIRVADDGCGIEKDDLAPVITRHSTSKISTAADLDSIFTLGFRGEALAAIASVSKLRIFSKVRGADMGALLEADGGKILSVSDTGCREGTTIIVEDLFHNVPARRKFLKKDATEAIAIGAVVEKIALSRPDIAFKYISDGEIKFMTTGKGDLSETIWALFGKELAHRSLKVDREENGIRITGYVSEPDLFRSNRNMENFFINGRYIKSKTASAALEQAYSSKIPQDKFPFCVLNIELNPSSVDVNVHPAKLEVKFANEKIIFDAVYYAVLSALEAAAQRPELELSARSAAKAAAKSAQSSFSTAFLPQDAKTKRAEQIRIGTPVKTDPPPAAVSSSAKPAPAHPKSPSSAHVTDISSVADMFPPEEAIPSPEELRQANRDAYENIRRASAFVPRGLTIPDTETADDGRTNAQRAAEQLRTQRVPRPQPVPEPNESEPEPNESELEPELPNPELPEPEPQVSEPELPDPEVPQEEFIPIPSDDVPPGEVQLPKETDTSAQSGAQSIVLPSVIEIREEDIPEYFILGEAFNCYVIVQTADRLLMIDKHAAHERILFDELCRKMHASVFSGQRGGQMLLAPYDIDLLSPEVDALGEYDAQIRALGFDYTVEKVGVSSYKAHLMQIPEDLDTASAAELFTTLADNLSETTASVQSAADTFFESRLWQASCKAAIKGGRVYDTAHIKWICDRLLKKPDEDNAVIRVCPHGRPVAFEIKKSSIDRQFARLT
ncbi:MAG: DNA mismatch repair endonuclease MutL [Clostridia bacterium]|nr:DNA mismatch repair endonuclease MutL [Clostridia bacterium]